MNFSKQILQASYFLLAFTNDFIGTNEPLIKVYSRLTSLKDFVFGTFAFPLALNVSILFWSLYAFDRQLVFPKEVDAFFPSWLNHILHTNIAVFVIIEMLILYHQYPSRKEGFTWLMTIMVSYLVWIFITRFFAGRFAYPILDVLNVPGKIAFFCFTMSFPIWMFLLGEFLNAKIWSEKRLLRIYQKNNGLNK